MTTLRVIVDDIVAPEAGRSARYAEELARALIAAAPRGSDVAGVISASPETDYALIGERLPGLSALYKSPLARPQLASAWQHGFTRLPGFGMVHAPSLLAPLFRHDRLNHPGDQTVVTIQDSLAWTRPELLPGRRAGATRTMGRRAERYADAVVVPTHAVADALAEHLALGDRVRVIGGAGTVHPHPRADGDEGSNRRVLPERYLLGVADGEPGAGFTPLVAALGRPELAGVDLVVICDVASAATLRSAAAEAGVERRVHLIVEPGDADLGAAFSGATMFVQPNLHPGSGAALLDAFGAGLPIVHSDAAVYVELVADAGVIVPLEGPDDYPERLATDIARVLDDSAQLSRLRTSSRDRALAYDWRDTAEKIWQLHADL